ncbi:MAG: hypothetical protein WCS77_05070 [Elusimicrobiaceae bacterium]
MKKYFWSGAAVVTALCAFFVCAAPEIFSRGARDFSAADSFSSIPDGRLVRADIAFSFSLKAMPEFPAPDRVIRFREAHNLFNTSRYNNGIRADILPPGRLSVNVAASDGSRDYPLAGTIEPGRKYDVRLVYEKGFFAAYCDGKTGAFAYDSALNPKTAGVYANAGETSAVRFRGAVTARPVWLGGWSDFILWFLTLALLFFIYKILEINVSGREKIRAVLAGGFCFSASLYALWSLNPYLMVLPEFWSRAVAAVYPFLPVILRFAVVCGLGIFFFHPDAARDALPPKIRETLCSRRFVAVVFLIGAAWFLFLEYYAITFYDSDEVRLFYDAVLMTRGLVPFRDFVARSPFIIYAIYPLAKAGVTSVYVYHAIAAALTLLSGWLLYKIAEKFSGKTSAGLTLALFVFCPLTINMLSFKTQSWAIPLALGSVLLYLRRKNGFGLVLSGILLGFAMLSRETAAAYGAIAVFSDLSLRREPRRFLRWGVYFGTGFLIYCVVVLLHGGGYVEGQVIGGQTSSVLRLVLASGRLYFVLPLVSAFALILAAGRFFTLLAEFRRDRVAKPEMMPAAVIIVLCALYLGQFWKRGGFYPEYIMEFSPFILILVAQALLGFWRYSKQLFCALIVSFAASGVYCVYLLGGSGLPFKTVETEVVPVMREISQGRRVTVLSGTPLFAFLTGNDNILLQSHAYYTARHSERITLELKNSPPEIIVKDVYYRKYFQNDPAIAELVREKYRRVLSIDRKAGVRDIELEVWRKNQ